MTQTGVLTADAVSVDYPLPATWPWQAAGRLLARHARGLEAAFEGTMARTSWRPEPEIVEAFINWYVTRMREHVG